MMVTITTVGYGDQIPTNGMSRSLAALAMLLGAAYLATPLAVIGNKFEDIYLSFEHANADKNIDAMALNMPRRRRMLRALQTIFEIDGLVQVIITQLEEEAKPRIVPQSHVLADKMKLAATCEFALDVTALRTRHELLCYDLCCLWLIKRLVRARCGTLFQYSPCETV